MFIKRTGDQRYRIWIHIGKNKRRTFGVKGTREQAKAEAKRLEAEFAAGRLVQPTKMTVAQFLTRFLDYYKSKVASKTFERDAEIITKHLIPAFGDYLVEKLSTMQIDRYYAQALQSGRRDGKGGLSPATIRNHHRVLRRALQQGVIWQELSNNAAERAESPRVERRPMVALDEPQMFALFKLFEGKRLFPLVVTLATTGMRRGEALALRWTDVDLDDGKLTVARSLEQTKGGLAFKQPKTRSGRRKIDLLPQTIEVLKAHKAAQARARLAAGPDWQDNGLVFTAPDGTPMRPGKATDIFMDRVVWQKFEPRLRLHDLRHTHATQLLRAGVHPKIVSERLGHAGIAITLDTYSHMLPGMQRDAVATLAKALDRAKMA
jgi:integrase